MQKGIVKGNVILGKDVSVWYNAVIRGDSDAIEIADGTNVQDGCVIHVDKGFPVHIGQRVTIGHGAIIHGCTIEDEVLIGMGAIVMNGASIGTHSIIGAGALIPENTQIPANSVVVGCPGKIIKQTTKEQVEMIINNAKQYIEEAKKEND
ncbi:MAG: gamma carbonic anhydrase family protein [Absicoccus porci]|uniref:gamma carbonic anhydrase family protein n=1 Tax=Absicoccus porci TaxID=2486576 RepID=UPI001FE4B68C|nr:gamma carbonic anhydrase family protein [Absicoccus porci]MCI6088740.1 gamma carbonic anhydrase family protein [Absicoccus porci]MDD7331090.1 gamma carbonic anhydrase family protein [Absicoccus porci]MDY4739531.1 gamma carbonic anhydrase family protein [Absicoccus porci]